MSSEDRSIVMVDWTRLNEPTPGNRNQFLWHQMLLSLLYDEVLAQDETFICSRRFAKWFRTPEDFRLLEELFECRGVRILKRPAEKYPQKLREKALEQPVTARREHLEEFSVGNDGNPLHFDDYQVDFHNTLEALLSKRQDFHRHAGSQRRLSKDLMREFGDLLTKVLTDSRYKKWLRTKFRSVTPQIAEDFVTYIENPNAAIDRLKQARGSDPRFTLLSGGPVFSTALAVQVAATYGDKAEELQSLIETVFAVPLCQDEGADGRYGQLLRDLPVPLEQEDSEISDVVKVEVAVKVPLRLPFARTEFRPDNK